MYLSEAIRTPDVSSNNGRYQLSTSIAYGVRHVRTPREHPLPPANEGPCPLSACVPAMARHHRTLKTFVSISSWNCNSRRSNSHGRCQFDHSGSPNATQTGSIEIQAEPLHQAASCYSALVWLDLRHVVVGRHLDYKTVSTCSLCAEGTGRMCSPLSRQREKSWS